MENLPEKLFELLEQKAFNELSNSEKDFVLKHVSLEEYTTLHLAAKVSQEFYNADKKRQVSSAVSKKIRSSFYSRQGQKNQEQTSSLIYWRAAAAVLLVLCSTLAYFTFNQNKLKTEMVYVPVHDTVFIKQVVQEKKLFADTLPINRVKNTRPKEVQLSKALLAIEVNRAHQEHPVSEFISSDINTISPSEISEDKIRLSGKSMSEDSLLRYFRFAGI